MVAADTFGRMTNEKYVLAKSFAQCARLQNNPISNLVISSQYIDVQPLLLNLHKYLHQVKNAGYGQ